MSQCNRARPVRRRPMTRKAFESIRKASTCEVVASVNATRPIRMRDPIIARGVTSDNASVDSTVPRHEAVRIVRIVESDGWISGTLVNPLMLFIAGCLTPEPMTCGVCRELEGIFHSLWRFGQDSCSTSGMHRVPLSRRRMPLRDAEKRPVEEANAVDRSRSARDATSLRDAPIGQVTNGSEAGVFRKDSGMRIDRPGA